MIGGSRPEGVRPLALVTSIPPTRPLPDERRRDIALSIRSFEANGFSVTSINRAAEIEGLGVSFPSVAFVDSERFDGIFKGSYGPSLGAIFDVCRRTELCGIVNADVYMIDGRIVDVLRQNPNTFYVARRVDVERFGGEIIGVYRRGFDAVFFSSSEFSALLEDDMLGNFQLGAPFWDILTPVLASFHGDVSFIDPPFILHPVHAANWSDADYALLRRTAVMTAVAHARRHAATRPRAAHFLRLIERRVGDIGGQLESRRHIRRAADVLNAWLLDLERSRRQRIETNLNDPIFQQSLKRFVARVDFGESIPQSPRKRGDLVSVCLRRIRHWRNLRQFQRLMRDVERGPGENGPLE